MPATPGASPVQAISASGGSTIVAGPATPTGPRSEPFGLEFGPAPGGALSLTLRGTYADKVYYLQTREDLTTGEWTTLSDSQVLGTGSPLNLSVTPDPHAGQPQLFYRAVEF